MNSFYVSLVLWLWCISRCRKRTKVYIFSVSHQSSCRLQGNHLFHEPMLPLRFLTSSSSNHVQWKLELVLRKSANLRIPFLVTESTRKNVQLVDRNFPVSADDVIGSGLIHQVMFYHLWTFLKMSEPTHTFWSIFSLHFLVLKMEAC